MGRDKKKRARLCEEAAAAAAFLIELMEKMGTTGRRGSIPGRKSFKRDYKDGYARLRRDYLDPNPVYPAHVFRRRFRMRRHVFDRVVEACKAYDPYFLKKYNCADKEGTEPELKVTAALRMLAYGKPADSLDAELSVSGTTIQESTKKFVRAIVAQFGDEYLRSPTQEDMNRILARFADRGFPGCMGSLDCMHWVWENCPSGWHGYYQGHFHKPTIIIEAIAGPDRWIRHCFAGMPGAINDINVLWRSHLFDNVVNGEAPEVCYYVNGREYNMGYYLADGIYPEWATLVKAVPVPVTDPQRLFTKLQQGYRKDIECAFGILQKKWGILKGSSRGW